MSQEYSTSNPFRRKGAASFSATVAPEPAPVVDDRAHQQTEASNSQSVDVTKKAAKKVRVQSPHPTSPSDVDLPSTLAAGDGPAYNRAPTPSQRDDDPFESASSDSLSEEDGAKPSQAPPNPFKKTLETMEPSKREAISSKPSVSHAGRASLDVEAFKRLLMTGNAGPGKTAPLPHIHHGLGDGGSSTDSSSLSRHSIFEPIQEQSLDSPSTPHEISETEDDRRGMEIISSPEGRKKPPPPSSRHGKLIKVELRDDPPSAPVLPIPTRQSSHRSSSGQSESISSPSSSIIRSPTDLNKPLPQAPERSSHDSDRQSIFDIESAGKVPEPPSPPQSIRRKTPPPPPLTRRHSQRVPDSRIVRADMERLSTSVEEETSNQTTPSISSIDPSASRVAPRSDSGRAPPPPPTRRPASIRGSVQESSSTGSSSIPISSPTSLPTRGSLFRERPQSMVVDGGANKRASMFPPPPPPPRHSDTSRRTSGETSRKSWDSARKGSETSSVQEETQEERPDILADLTKLQREIDALRSRGERSVS